MFHEAAESPASAARLLAAGFPMLVFAPRGPAHEAWTPTSRGI